jgi:DNA mismatch repair protein MutS
VPSTIEQVQERQKILKGFLENWAVLENFTYPRLYLNEVYGFFQKIAAGEFTAEPSVLKAQLRLRLSENERNQKRAQLIQVVLLLNNISGRYLGRLNKSKYPEEFKWQLERVLSVLSKLNLPFYAAAINQDQFSVAKLLAFEKTIFGLSPEEIKAFWQFFFLFEAYYSVARAIRQHHFTFPEFQAQQFSIWGLYHPLVPNAVKNDISLNRQENTVLLTGPNMSGKSTLLKAVGLCVYLAHIGLAVPAAACQLPFYESIVIAINVNDNLRSGYSQFMAEICNLKTVLQEATAGKKCFAIFDELFKGTNIDDAQEITLTTINGLGKFKESVFFLSTHLVHLQNQLPGSSVSIGKYYIHCTLEAGIPVFTYELKKGWSDLKIGKILFEQEGLAQLLTD